MPQGRLRRHVDQRPVTTNSNSCVTVALINAPGTSPSKLIAWGGLVELKSDYRAVFHQDVSRVGGETALVEGEVHLVAVDRAHKLVRLPAHVIALAKDRLGSG